MFNRLKASPVYEFVLPAYGMYDVVRWYAFGKRLPVPHLVKQKMIRECALKYGLKNMVETGTYLGNMAAAMASVFEKIITIELDPMLCKRARKKFSNLKNIEVVEGDSGKVLPWVAKKIGGPTLFWLDAHYSGGITSMGKTDSPIEEELAVILNRKVKKDIILIDDANAFVGKFGYPTIGKLRKIVKEKWKNASVVVSNNIISIIV